MHVLTKVGFEIEIQQLSQMSCPAPYTGCFNAVKLLTWEGGFLEGEPGLWDISSSDKHVVLLEEAHDIFLWWKTEDIEE